MADKKKYGTTYKFSTGAVDIVCDDIENAFDEIMGMVNSGKITVGQVILETGKHSKWIHISNPKSLMYSLKAVHKMDLNRDMFLISTNNGKSYRCVKQ